MGNKKAFVFINYRRRDTSAYAGWLHHRLTGHLGAPNIFKDLDSVPAGTDFTTHIAEAIAKCDVLLALVGANWNAESAGGIPSLHAKNDWVRKEIESALSQGKEIIPILVEGAKLPSPVTLPQSLQGLLSKQALTLSADSFDDDFRRILSAIRLLTGPQNEVPQAAKRDQAARFIEVERIFREKVQVPNFLGRIPDKYMATYRRKELDRLVASLGRHQEIEIVNLAIGRFLVSSNYEVEKEKSDLKKAWDVAKPVTPPYGLLALTAHAIMYVPRRQREPVDRIAYERVVGLDASTLGGIAVTLSSHNVGIIVSPIGKTMELYADIKERLHRA
ncbi:toll/interleukin-1 receptor domain-containing protein [Streptomyces galilaeus]|uniref:toll/interleukin-1 receptor domain-containing protein n=1 Tax=Streptomyces galilaeus TaxID=33899 RepID=UPI0038F71E92